MRMELANLLSNDFNNEQLGAMQLVNLLSNDFNNEQLGAMKRIREDIFNKARIHDNASDSLIRNNSLLEIFTLLGSLLEECGSSVVGETISNFSYFGRHALLQIGDLFIENDQNITLINILRPEPILIYILVVLKKLMFE